MKKGLSRFEFFFNQLQTLLNAAAKQKNPALWLYRNNARTPLFMLEALAKLYAELHNNKKFSKIKEHFKLLEDGLGAIDYYDAITKDLATNKKIPAKIMSYLLAETREKIQSLNEILVEKDWLETGNNRLTKIHKKLTEADWLEEKEEIAAINEFYGEAIYEITEFSKETGLQFDNMEKDVHELRRKVRWLSIYPQALLGCIQLQKNKTMPRHLKKYATPEITGSSFNKMPDAGNCKYLLLLEQNYFFSLSWLIAELGKLKDSGLHVIAIKETLVLTEGLDEAAAFKKTQIMLGAKQPAVPVLLDQAETICNTYFKEQNLEHLVVGSNVVK